MGATTTVIAIFLCQTVPPGYGASSGISCQYDQGATNDMTVRGANTVEGCKKYIAALGRGRTIENAPPGAPAYVCMTKTAPDWEPVQ